MTAYFCLRGEWIRLIKDTDKIDGYEIDDFAELLVNRNVKLNPSEFVKVVHNGRRYLISVTNLLFDFGE